MSERTLYLVDGYNLIFRAYYAMIKNPLRTSKGFNTSAIFGVLQMLKKLFLEYKPFYLAIILDTGKPTFRNRIYPEYKANRKEVPDELKAQFPVIEELFQMLGFPVIKKEGFEADDLIGSIARKAAAEGFLTYIFTGDRDLFQLVDDNTRIILVKQGISRTELYDRSRLISEGLPPEKVPFFKALAGDSSDNIPGIPGIGEKTALALISQFSSLDDLYRNIEKVPGEKRRKTILENRKLAELSLELARIVDNLEVDISVYSLVTGQKNESALREFIVKYELASQRDFLLSGGEAASGAVEEKEKDLFLWNVPDAGESETVVVDTQEKLSTLIRKLEEADAFVVDLETTAENALEARLVGVAVAVDGRRGYYIPVSHRIPDSRQLDERDVLEKLRPFLESGEKVKVAHNIKYEMNVFAGYGVQIADPYFDTMIGSYLIAPEKRRHNLDILALEWLNYRTQSFSELMEKSGARSIQDVAIDDAARYAAEDAYITWRLYEREKIELEKLGLLKLMNEIEIPLVRVLARMEAHGIRVDRAKLIETGKELDNKIRLLEKDIYALAGEEFNIGSPRQLGRILFEKLKLPPVKKKKTGQSTDVGVLEELATKHELPALILEYRAATKLKSTYITGLLQATDREEIIHTSFNQTVVSTGRLSSSEPNLQNIPVRTAEGRKIREAFIPRSSNYLLVSLDYSQIELRILAHISGDRKMLEAFRAGQDIHEMTATAVFGVSKEQVTPEMRRRAKVINFGIIYGMGPHRLTKELGISYSEAQSFINSYFENYPGVRCYIESTIESARKNGYVETLLGRRRYFPFIDSKNRSEREASEREAVNARIQGTAADLIKVAMIRIDRLIEEEKLPARMLLQVHDELVFEIEERSADLLSQRFASIMENALPLSVPLVVDIKKGRNWNMK